MVEYWKKAPTGGARFRLRASDYGGQVVASGHDRAWPSKGLYSASFHRSTFPTFQ